MPPTLLFIDQDHHNLSVFYRAVKGIDRSIHCLLQTNSESAIEQLETETNQSPDLIFLDLNMPKICGRDCLKHIRHMVRYRSTPVIICAEPGSEKAIQESQELGASSFLSKPFTVKDLRANLLSMLYLFLRK